MSSYKVLRRVLESPVRRGFASRVAEEIVTLGFDSLVELTVLTSGLVTIAFLLALRLLIRDFFSIDMACSLLRIADALYVAKRMPNFKRFGTRRAHTWSQ